VRLHGGGHVKDLAAQSPQPHGFVGGVGEAQLPDADRQIIGQRRHGIEHRVGGHLGAGRMMQAHVGEQFLPLVFESLLGAVEFPQRFFQRQFPLLHERGDACVILIHISNNSGIICHHFALIDPPVADHWAFVTPAVAAHPGLRPGRLRPAALGIGPRLAPDRLGQLLHDLLGRGEFLHPDDEGRLIGQRFELIEGRSVTIKRIEQNQRVVAQPQRRDHPVVDVREKPAREGFFAHLLGSEVQRRQTRPHVSRHAQLTVLALDILDGLELLSRYLQQRAVEPQRHKAVARRQQGFVRHALENTARLAQQHLPQGLGPRDHRQIFDHLLNGLG